MSFAALIGRGRLFWPTVFHGQPRLLFLISLLMSSEKLTLLKSGPKDDYSSGGTNLLDQCPTVSKKHVVF